MTQRTNQQKGEGMNELNKAVEKLKIALLEPEFIRTLILVWVVMAGTIFILWITGELQL